MNRLRKLTAVSVVALSLFGASCADEDNDGAGTDEEVNQVDEGVEDGVDQTDEEIDEGTDEVDDSDQTNDDDH